MARQPVFAEAKDFNGMFHSMDGNTPADNVLWMAQNIWPMDPENPSALQTRPPINPGGKIASSGTFSCIADFPGLATPFVIAVVGGEIYTTPSGNRTVGATWTRQITVSNLTSNSITLGTNNVFATLYNKQMVFSDGVNTPFMWDGTASGGLTKLTNAPVFFGALVVYYGKLFGILASDTRTIQWSEENAANTGYTAGGFNNTWSLTQNSQLPLNALAATNQALYYFRAESIGMIGGAVTPDFTTTGVHDAIASNVGLGAIQNQLYAQTNNGNAPAQPTVVDDTVYFWSQDRRPFRLDGKALTDLSPAIQAAITDDYVTGSIGYPYAPASASANPWVTTASINTVGQPTYHRGLVMFWFIGADSGPHVIGNYAAVFTHRSGKCLGYLITKTAGNAYIVTINARQSMAVSVVSYNSNPGFEHIWMVDTNDLNVGVYGEDGRFGTASPVDSFGAPAGTPVTQNIQTAWATRPLVRQETVECDFDRVSVEGLLSTANAVTLGIQYLTSVIPSWGNLPSAITVTPTTNTRQKLDIGTSAYGRWLTLFCTTNYTASTGGRTDIFGFRVDGFADVPDTGMK